MLHSAILPSSAVEVVVLIVDLKGLIGAHGSDDDEMEISARLASGGGDVEGLQWWWLGETMERW